MSLKSLIARVCPHARACRFFAFVLAGLSFCIVGSERAHASAGCTAINANNLNDNLTLLAGVGAGSIKTVSNLVAGDTLTFTVTFSGATPNWEIDDGALTVLKVAAVTSLTFSYTVTGGADTTIVQGVNTLTPGDSVSSVVTCVPAGTKGIVTDSQKLAALVAATTKTVANTSGQVITTQVQGAIDDAFSANGTPTNFGPNGGFINFAAEPEQTDVKKRADDAFAALGYAADKSPKLVKATPRLEREWSAWADIRGTGWKVNDTTGLGNDLKGNQVNVTAGLGRKLDPDTLVGVVVGYENFKYDVAALAGSLKGDGESIGAYFARRLGSTVRFDAMVGWTHLNYNAVAGAATGSFTGGRWVASTGLTATYKFDMYVFEPSAKVYALWENEKAWTDSLGTAMAARNFSAGRTALGAKVGRAYSTANSWTLTPTVGFYGDYRFQTDNALPTGTLVGNIASGWSGRATAGLSSRGPGGCVISLDGEYGGIGANYKIWTGSARATIPF